MKQRLITLTLLAASTIASMAAADTNAVAQINNANDTWDTAMPIGIAIMGTFMGVTIVRRVWGRFAK